MTHHQHPALLLQFSTERPLLNGDFYLTLSQFLHLLKQNKVHIGRATLYRWITFPKTHLPTDVRNILAPAPPQWVTNISNNRPGSSTGKQYVIPLSYISETCRRRVVGAIRYQERPSKTLVSQHTITANIQDLQKRLKELEDLVEKEPVAFLNHH